MALKDVLDGFDRLAEALREVNISKSIGEAQTQVDALQQKEMNEFERSRAQRAIAQATGARVMQLGGNAFAAQQAMAALAPQPIDMKEAQLEATGESTVSGAVAAIERKTKAEEAAKEERNFQRDIKKIEASGEQSRLTAEAKASSTPKKIPKAVENRLLDLDVRRAGLKQLLEDFKTNPKLSSAIGPMDQFRPDMLNNADAVAFRRRVLEDFNEYRRMVTGAAASIPELKSLKPAALTVGDTEANFLAKANDIIRSGETVQKALVARGKKIGYDMSGYEGSLDFEKEEEKEEAPSGSTKQPPSAIPGFKVIKKN